MALMIRVASKECFMVLNPCHLPNMARAVTIAVFERWAVPINASIRLDKYARVAVFFQINGVAFAIGIVGEHIK
tara:strand:+ start:847 stop:1068 length:222 start_codon:yes stop_codon:yes gene_type:complete